MCLKPFLKWSFSLLEKSTIWSFELLKRNSVISLCCYTLDLIEGLQRKSVAPTLHWNKICDFCYPLQNVQQKGGFFTTLACPTRRAMGQCAKLAWTQAEVGLYELYWYIHTWPTIRRTLCTHTKYFSFFLFFSFDIATQAVYHYFIILNIYSEGHCDHLLKLNRRVMYCKYSLAY